MKEVLEEIGSELGVEPKGIIQRIRSLPKAREMEELRAQIVGLLKENADLQTQVVDRDRKVKEAEARAASAEEEKIRTEAEREKWHTTSKKFFDFVGFPGNVVTKARLYDQCMKKPEVEPTPKILHMLVDFSRRVENLLKELRILFQYDRRGQEAGPSERRLEPNSEPTTRPEPTSPPASTLGASVTGEPSTPIPRPEAPQDQPEPAATPVIPDPTRQEPIPDSLNIDDILSLHQWATDGFQDSATPATGSQGPMDPVVRITPGFVTRSWQGRTGSVQTNLFGGTQEDPSIGFHQWMRRSQAQQEEQAKEEWSSSEAEEDPIDDEDDKEEDEEEEEDPGSNEGYGSREEEEGKDSPLASAHRPVTRSTPNKLVFWSKRKAHRSKGFGLGSGSRKRSKGQR